MENHFRKLKIYSKFRSNVYSDYSVPSIRLEGKWLHALGFEEGMKVKIVERKKELVITLEED